MNLIDSLGAHAESHVTTYFLHGRMIYPDEIFGADGFLPLIGRMAERRLSRTLEGVKQTCGFVYTPFAASVFKEKIDILPAGDGIYEDSLRLAALVHTCRDVVGMGMDATLDLTPVYEFFTGLKRENRDALRDANEEFAQWPLYQPIQVS